MNEDPDLPGICSIDDLKSDHEWLIDDFVNFGGFDRATITSILKGFENETLSKKVSLVSDHCKKAEKKAKDEEQKKKEKDEKDKKKPKEEMKEESKEEIKEEASQETTIVTSQVSEISEVT